MSTSPHANRSQQIMPAEEIHPEVIQKTQKVLSKYVKKPPLTEKLLRKPPFRFLHDIINAVIKETGFLRGLFTNDELNSDNVKEREAKVAFLTKLIDAVKAIANTNLAARPSKIVAGLEPTETNLLLQAIGKAIEKKLDSSEYVKQLRAGDNVPNEKKKTKKDDKPKIRVTSKEKLSDKKSTTKIDDNNRKITTKEKPREKRSSSKGDETPKSTDRSKSKTKDEIKLKSKEKNRPKQNAGLEPSPKENSKSEKPLNLENTIVPHLVNQNSVIVDGNDEQVVAVEEEKRVEEPPQNEDVPAIEEHKPKEEDIKRPISANRPKSARPKSGIRKVEAPPKSSLRPPSVRPSSARPGAPRLRPDSALALQDVTTMGKINVIVENFDNVADEEETVIIQNNPEIEEEEAETEKIEVSGENKGHLVEQILEQINEKEKTKVDIDWQDGLHNKDATNKEVTQLRALIQSLTKTANPLGKLLNYLHEDIDAMHNELEYWTNMKKQLFAEIQKQKKISSESNKPILDQLDALNQEIRKQEDEIVNVRNNILRNDQKIKELLVKK